jgi:hypothetical protein
MANFKITIQRVVREDYEVEIEADDIMLAFDMATSMVAKRNERTNNGKFYVTKIETSQE